jgi:hypothetical protein
MALWVSVHYLNPAARLQGKYHYILLFDLGSSPE